jgi:outer membrane protein TolC
LVRNLDLSLTRAHRELAQARRQKALGALLPRLEAGAGATRLLGRVQGSFGEIRDDLAYSTFAPQVALVYRLNFARAISRAQAEADDVIAVKFAHLDQRQRVLLNVAVLFQSLVLAKIATAIAEALVSDGRQFISIVKARATSGVGPASSVERAAAKLAADGQHLVDTRRTWQQVSVRLATGLRLDPGRLLDPVAPRLEPYTLPLPRAAHARRAAARRHDIRVAQQAHRAAERQANGALWDLIAPELRAELRQTWIGDTGGLGGQTSVGGLLLWSISYDKFGQLLTTRAQRAIARLRLKQQMEHARAELELAEQALHAAALKVPLAKQGLEAAERNLHLSLARFRAGVAIALEIFDAQDAAARARLDLARTLVSYNIAQLRVLATAGLLRKENLVR